MKNTLNICMVIFCMTFLSVTSCISSQGFIPVRGTGVSADKDYNVTDFSGIRVSGGFDVILVQGNTEGVTITAQENLFEYITVEVVQGVLNIYTEENVMATKPMKARISFKLIDRLKVSGGGDIICETPLNVPQLDTEISGGGDLTAEVNTEELRCHMSGGGDASLIGTAGKIDIDMSGGGDLKTLVDVNHVSCNLSGGGDLTLKSNTEIKYAGIELSGGGDLDAAMNADQVKFTLSGGGDAHLNGKASVMEINITGGGDVSADGFVSGIARIQANGGSDVHVKVSEELTGQITGGGDIYYSGNPDKVSIDTRGGSEIHKQ